MPPATSDLLGKTFGRLRVIGWNGYKRRWGQRGKLAHWLCECQCGDELEVEANHLKRGKTRSCGCLARETAKELATALGLKNAKNTGTIAARQVYARYKNDARRRGLNFDLSYSEAMSIHKMDCAYCGIKPSTVSRQRGTTFIYNGIDRVDNNIGYTHSNSVPCCKRCNEIKRNRTYEDFRDWVGSAYQTMFMEQHANIHA